MSLKKIIFCAKLVLTQEASNSLNLGVPPQVCYIDTERLLSLAAVIRQKYVILIRSDGLPRQPDPVRWESMWCVGMRSGWRARSSTKSVLWSVSKHEHAEWLTRMQLHEATRPDSNWHAVRMESEIAA